METGFFFRPRFFFFLCITYAVSELTQSTEINQASWEVKCSVCRAAITSIWEETGEKSEQDGHALHSEDIFNITKNICNEDAAKEAPMALPPGYDKPINPPRWARQYYISKRGKKKGYKMLKKSLEEIEEHEAPILDANAYLQFAFNNRDYSGEAILLACRNLIPAQAREISAVVKEAEESMWNLGGGKKQRSWYEKREGRGNKLQEQLCARACAAGPASPPGLVTKDSSPNRQEF